MPANLFGERFIAAREPAWHKMGKVFIDPITAVEAAEQSGCDYEVFKSPLYANVNPMGRKTLKPLDGQFTLTRQPTPDDDQYRFFGVVTEDYEILDNLEIARALDVLTDRWPVETMGALNEGKTLFVALDAGEINIGKDGETVHQFFVFTDRKDGTQKAKFMFTPVRVVCQNTLIMGERSARVNAEITHKSGASQALQFRVDIIDQLLKVQAISLETLQNMASITITNKQAAQIISAAYPMPKKSPDAIYAEDENALKGIKSTSLAEQLFQVGQHAVGHYEYMRNRTQTYADFATNLYEQINDDNPAIARTPWAAYNAVVEAADWRGGRGNIDYSALFGGRAREKVLAYNAAERITVKASKQ